MLRGNLFFVGLKDGREPVAFFNSVEGKITVAPVAEQVEAKTVKTKDGERVETVAKPFYCKHAETVLETLSGRFYKTPDETKQNAPAGERTE